MTTLRKRIAALEVTETRATMDLSDWTDEQLTARIVEIHEELAAAGCPLPNDWRDIIARGHDHSLNPIIEEWGKHVSA